MIPKFLTTSYDLFNDKDSFKGTLVAANVFDSDVFEKAWKGWEGNFRIIHAGLFLHLFSWDQQLSVCDALVKLMSKETGALFLGEMVGCEGGGERNEGKSVRFWKKEKRKQFLHDEKSFARLWGVVAKRTGTVDCWKVGGAFRKRGLHKDSDGSGGCAFFTGEGIGVRAMFPRNLHHQVVMMDQTTWIGLEKTFSRKC